MYRFQTRLPLRISMILRGGGMDIFWNHTIAIVKPKDPFAQTERRFARLMQNATNEWIMQERSWSLYRRSHKKDVLLPSSLSLSRGTVVGKLNERKGNNWHRISGLFFGWKLHIISLQSCSESGSYVAWAFRGLHAEWHFLLLKQIPRKFSFISFRIWSSF